MIDIKEEGRKLGLTSDRLSDPAYNYEIFQCLSNLHPDYQNEDINSLFDTAKEFEGNYYQLAGLLQLGLKGEQVFHPAYSGNVFHDMKKVKEQGITSDFRNIFETLKNIGNEDNQLKKSGIIRLGLTLEQVNSKAFNQHTYNFLLATKQKYPEKDINMLFEKINGLDLKPDQLAGVLIHNLEVSQVKSEAFSSDIFSLLLEAKENTPSLKMSDLFKKVKGLKADYMKAKGVLLLGLSPSQVENKYFNKKSLLFLEKVKKERPEVNISTFFDGIIALNLVAKKKNKKTNNSPLKDTGIKKSVFRR